jgi:hypothetical protein
MKTILKIVACLFIIGITTKAPAYSQQSAKDKKAQKAATIKNIIEAKNFVFTAQTMMPMGGMSRNLTSFYDVRVSPDTIVSYLPYFGRAYSAPIDPSKNALDFTSTNFDYKVSNRKKGGWDINIVSRDQPDNQRLSFAIFEDGSGTLQVTSNNRQPISYNGYVSERKPNRRK